MAEAEDVITDAARHTAVYIHALWRRHRPLPPGPSRLRLPDAARRLHLLAAAAFGRSFRIRSAQPPAPATWLQRLLRQPPRSPLALPATDDADIWLPPDFGLDEPDAASLARYRVLMLQQAMRAVRGSAAGMPHDASPVLRALYLLCEAQAADAALVRLLPGMAPAVAALRQQMLRQRPPLPALRPELRPVEEHLRALLALPATAEDETATPALALRRAQALAAALPPSTLAATGRVFVPDWWTGELRPRAAPAPLRGRPADDDGTPVRSARLPRSPRVRQAGEDEDDSDSPGPSMVQTAEPQQMAADPMGMQRPVDRDGDTAAEEFADALSELDEARLVATPGKPEEVLASSDPPEGSARLVPPPAAATAGSVHRYPEWDWRREAYVTPGATVHVRPAPPGQPAWADDVLARRASLLSEVRRRFELLRAGRQRLSAQLDGDDIDLQAWIDAQADFRAGLPLSQRLYRSERRARRELAIALLVDISGSTDGWVSPASRVIDVEREALLLVCIALDTLGERFAVQAFSGEGPHGVTVLDVKPFAAPLDGEARLRIAGLEPDRYTRAGAALRHTTAGLAGVPAAHRLLLLLSDGKPNDLDGYDGQYGVEDMRQAVTEARLQGIVPFCLTVDHAAPAYLPRIFGPGHYGLLPRTELMPAVLLEWLRKLVSR